MNNAEYYFSAIAKMQKKNIEKYGINQIGPFQPECMVTDAKVLDLKQAVANFFYKSCEGLKYEKAKELEFESGEYTGKSPIEYRNTVRIAAAKRLIKTGELTVSEAAYLVGFNNMSFFYEAYNKY